MPRRIIEPHQRGRKPPMSPGEKTVRRVIYVPASLAAWWDRMGVKRIRAILQDAAAKDKRS